MFLIDLFIIFIILLNIGLPFDFPQDLSFSEVVNPIVIYKNTRLNLFGVILVSILANVCLPVISVPYWIYKLCTVGRKDCE